MKKIALILLILLLLLCFVGCGIFDQLTCQHDYKEEETVQPTCTKKGYIKYVCTLCEHVKYQDIDRLPHEFAKQDTVAPTCSSTGYTNYTCSICGETKQDDVVEKLPHSYTEKVVAPSCTNEGYTEQKCSVCGETNIVNKTDVLAHNYESVVTNPTCTTQGYTMQTCKDCGFEQKADIVDALGHTWNQWVTQTPATEVNDGLKTRTCKVCEEVEEQVIPAVVYTDNSALKLQWDPTKTQTVNTLEEMCNYFSSAVLNNYATTTYDIKFAFERDTLLQQLVDNCTVPFSYDVQSSLTTTTTGGEKTYLLTLTLNVVNPTPTASTSGSDYTQLASANVKSYKPTRSNTWDDFAYKQRSLTVNVSSTEQLWYVLEQGGKPVPVAGSSAERILNKMKAVLRQICDDSMTDTQKVVAIHDWVVLNVNYDHKLLELMNEGQAVSHYDAFFLEGAFDNNKAVCEGIAKAVACLCNMEGLPCVTVEGVPADNPTGVGHAWNKVLMDGAWYIVDATSDNPMINGTPKIETLSYRYFGLTDSQYTSFTATNRQDIVCKTEMDIYSQLSFTYYSAKADFVIVSPAELTTLLRYLFATEGDITVECVVAFDVGASAQDEISTALSQVTTNGSTMKFVENGTTYTLIKNDQPHPNLIFLHQKGTRIFQSLCCFVCSTTLPQAQPVQQGLPVFSMLIGLQYHPSTASGPPPFPVTSDRDGFGENGSQKGTRKILVPFVIGCNE